MSKNPYQNRAGATRCNHLRKYKKYKQVTSLSYLQSQELEIKNDWLLCNTLWWLNLWTSEDLCGISLQFIQVVFGILSQQGSQLLYDVCLDVMLTKLGWRDHRYSEQLLEQDLNLFSAANTVNDAQQPAVTDFYRHYRLEDDVSMSLAITHTHIHTWNEGEIIWGSCF